MRARRLVCLVLGSVSWACSSPPAVIPARNLERPSDMAMVCLQVDADQRLSGRPMSVCHPTAETEPPIQESATSPRRLGTFALVSNSARGEVAAVDLDENRLVDLDPVVFGFNMAQLGASPESLAASPDGCWVASANRVSCDIGVVDPSRLLSSLFRSATPATLDPSLRDPNDPKASPAVSPVRPLTASGKWLQLAPKEIVFLKPDLDPDGKAKLCTGQPALALVSFPSCDLVALVELPSGNIKDSVYVGSDGTVPAGTEPVCPVDSCLDAGPVAPLEDAGVGEEGDGGAGDGGEMVAPGSLGVGAMVLRPDRPTVYVGASHGDDFLAVLDVVAGKLVDAGRIALERGAMGINHLRLSVDPWKTVNLGGSFVETRGQFLYAFAQDGSVRVVDVGAQPGRECDVNVRPELTGLPVTTPCFPVNPAARRPLAQGPGIRVPALPSRTSAPPVPRDIAVIDLLSDSLQIETNPQALAGQFAFLLASDTVIYVLNLSPQSPGDQVMTHSFREYRSNGQFAADMLMPVTTPPLRTTVTSDLLYPSTPLLSSTNGPRLERVSVDVPPAVPISSNFVTNEYFANFPNQGREVSRTINITWEDMIPRTERSSGKLSPPGDPSTPAGALDDQGADFCGKGVLPGDLVVLPGCSDDADCSPQELYSCHLAGGGAIGLCLPKDASQELVEKCERFTGSRRRYEIRDATPTRLSLGLHLDEVPKTVLNRAELMDDPQNPGQKIPSLPDSACQPVTSLAHKAAGTRLGFSWQQVWPEDVLRCVQPCALPRQASDAGKLPKDFDRDCRPGFVCEALPGALPATGTAAGAVGYCVEAPPLDSECWPQPGNSYHVNAGNSFLVSGTVLPDLVTAKAVNGHCQAAPDNPLLVNRIPMSAPQCTTLDGTQPFQGFSDPTQPANTAVALFGPLAGPGTFRAPYSWVGPPSPNPCLYLDHNHDEGGAPSGVPTTVKAVFENPETRFVLTNLDDYAGDDLFTQLSLKGGFIPFAVTVPTFDVALTQPIRLFISPTKLPDSPFFADVSKPAYPYVYVLDQGRTALTPGSRGQIVRINALKGDNAVTTLDAATTGTQPFQIQ